MLLAVFLLQNEKVVEAADDLVLLEKRHPGYWKWLNQNVVEVDVDQDGTDDVTIYPVSKIYKSGITSDDYRIFLRNTSQNDNPTFIYFLDGTGTSIQKNEYGVLDTSSWTIAEGRTADWTSIEYEEKPINEVTDIYEYLSRLRNSDYSFVISVMDESMSSWNEELEHLLCNLRLSGGIKWRDSYIAVVDKGRVIYEKHCHEPLNYTGSIEDNNLSVVSKAWDIGNDSSILINDTEYSKRQRGLNIVVLKRGEVIDSVNFDTFYPLLTCNR